MRLTIVGFALVLLGCAHPTPPEPAAIAPASPAPVVAAPSVDAAAVAAIAPDAAEPDASDEPDYSFYEHDALGPLHTHMTEAELVAALGKPTRREKPFDEPASGAWVSTWTWRNASAGMIADHATGPWTARSVSITWDSKFATKRGIHLGSTFAELQQAYPRSPDDQQQEPNQYLVGSRYGGMLFFVDHDRVVGIDIGPFGF